MAASMTLRSMRQIPHAQAITGTLRALIPQRSRPVLRCAQRNYSSSPKPSNPTSDFYKTFTRPVGKVLVLAIFTYQVAYWTWAKLESDEKCQEADATIAGLEKTVDEYKKSKDSNQSSKTTS